MADIRALLKAKREEVRISHPLASYTTGGQLKCLACGTNIKQASAWEGHVGSKGHRINAAARRREDPQGSNTEITQDVLRRRVEEAKRHRRGGESAAMDDGEFEHPASATKKRKLDPAEGRHAPGSPAFPPDFFSDPTRTMVSSVEAEDEAEAEEGEGEEENGHDNERGQQQDVPTKAAVDLEWEQFQQSVLNPPDIRDAYERATVAAEPMLAPEIPEGFPALAAQDIETESQPANEDEARRRQEQDDRELIMDRLLDEERAQEEADAKVAMLKQRLETLRRQRAAKAEAKGKK